MLPKIGKRGSSVIKREKTIVAEVKLDPVTEEEKAKWPEPGPVKLEKPFVDARG